MKRDFGVLVSSKKKVKGVWKRRFEHAINGEEPLVTSMGMVAGKKKSMCGERMIERVEVQ